MFVLLGSHYVPEIPFRGKQGKGIENQIAGRVLVVCFNFPVNPGGITFFNLMLSLVFSRT